MSAEQQLITIDDISADNAPAIYGHNSLHRYVEAARQSIVAEVPDLSSVKGRKRIAHLAAEVARSKTGVDKAGRAYLKRLKEMTTPIEAELRVFGSEMDALRDEVRKPLDDWQAAEDTRINEHEANIQSIKDMAVFAETPTASYVSQLIADLELFAIDDSWEEFLPEVAQVKDKSLATLRALLVDRTQVEADLAAIAKFNAEQAVRDQQARDAEIARAAVAEAQNIADQAAQAEREASARREQALLDQAAQAKRDAEQATKDAEALAANQALQIKLQAEQALNAAALAETNRIAAEQRAEQERIAAVKRQAAAVEQARLDQIRRQNDAADAIIRQQDALKADKAHKGAIYKESKEAFMQHGMTEECARLAVKLIASSMIPNIKITY
ncbi:hypothetical protein QN386_17850 [Pseudomonas sp. CCI3.2]|uniref:hypothetical protein n=1 Tax=unclassified Pseudomonas TaxID=196821 RepID=UPI002B23709A|nr:MULTISPECIES: hypothetical protein [unclassified Pseudomonas]MEB0078056.1 hypothetical protein [Pseudomonas sp. MH10out]MEB0103173.1 hypothetical protein [Pseudomonas sp. CCI3.2]MEB0133409.1 hypothetical protein [Pseudomonas sp. CCI2.4]